MHYWILKILIIFSMTIISCSSEDDAALTGGKVAANLTEADSMEPPYISSLTINDSSAATNQTAVSVKLSGIDAVGIILYFTLMGAGDTKILPKLQIIKTWLVLVPFTYLFLFYFKWGVLGAWLALGCELVVITILCGARLKQGKWKKIQV